MTRFLLRHFVAISAVLALSGYVCIYSLGLANAPIRADGYSYFVYLPSWFIYGDPTLERVARECCGGEFPAFTAIIRWPGTGHFVNAHPVGVAVMQAPFFLAALGLSWWSNLPRDGFSLYFQHGAGMAGMFYFLAGLAVLCRLLRRHFTDKVALATLVAITFGTNLYHYGVFESGYSHAFSFFLITSLVAVTEQWWTEPTWRRSTLLGLLCGLIVLVRHPNLLFVAIVPLYGVAGAADLRLRAAALWARRSYLAVLICIAVALVLPQLLLYRMATAHWFVSSYGELGFAFTRPHIAEVLFGVTKGLFFWSPLLLLAVAGLFVARGSPSPRLRHSSPKLKPQISGGGIARALRLAMVVVFVLHTYIIASWWDWQFGASFGHRGFVDMLGLFALSFAALLAWAAERTRLRVPIVLTATVCVALSVVQMLHDWWRILPISDTTWDQYRAVFLRFP